MIFVTVGSQMPFDRLVLAVDTWAGQVGRSDIYAQIGHAKYKPRSFGSCSFLNPDDLRMHMENASAVVSHAGVGTVLTALQFPKPLLVLPRSGLLKETRNDHQVAFAKAFADDGLLLMASNCADLVSKLGMVESFKPRSAVPTEASPQLLRQLREFVFHGQT